MLLGRPLLAATSRSGNASPDERNADSSCEEWTTDLTRYGSRPGGLSGLSGFSALSVLRETRMLQIRAVRRRPPAGASERHTGDFAQQTPKGAGSGGNSGLATRSHSRSAARVAVAKG